MMRIEPIRPAPIVVFDAPLTRVEFQREEPTCDDPFHRVLVWRAHERGYVHLVAAFEEGDWS